MKTTTYEVHVTLMFPVRPPATAKPASNPKYVLEFPNEIQAREYATSIQENDSAFEHVRNIRVIKSEQTTELLSFV